MPECQGGLTNNMAESPRRNKERAFCPLSKTGESGVGVLWANLLVS